MRSTVLLTAIVLALLGGHACADEAVEAVRIDATNHRLFEGWGTSLCWWAHRVGDWPDDRLDALLELIADPENGLGYTVFRYNIGGGDAPGHNHMRPGGDIPGFKAGPDRPYDWQADANQRRVLLKLHARVPDAIFEAFSNSPPYWMTVSGCASGAQDGGDNLRADGEAAFADYLTEVVRHYRDQYQIVFRTLNPMNEPNAGWWRAGHNQEGCHVSVAQQQRLIQQVAQALKQKQLTATGVAAPETNNLDDGLKDVQAYDAATLAALAQINTHTYAGAQRTALHEFAQRHAKRLWQSESGPLDMRSMRPLDTYLAMAERIVADLNMLQAAAWLDWQVIDGPMWGCIHVNDQTHTFRTSPKFPFYAIFTQSIRPGDALINLDRPDVLAALSDTRRVLAIVVVNASNEARTYRLMLAGVRPAADHGRLRRTSETESLVDVGAVPIDEQVVTVRTVPRAVTAVLIPVALGGEQQADSHAAKPTTSK